MLIRQLTECTLASIYNDGKGLLFGIEFQPLLPPLKEGEKRRKNAKAKTINTTVYIHEGAPLTYLVGMAYKALKRNDLSWRVGAGGAMIGCDVEMKYTIAKTQLKMVTMESQEDYAVLLGEATKKAVPEIKIYMTEVKVRT